MTVSGFGRRVAVGLALAVLAGAGRLDAQVDTTHQHHDMRHMDHGTGPTRMPPMPKGMKMPMVPGTEGLAPRIQPYLPTPELDPASIPVAVPRRLIEVADGDSLELDGRPSSGGPSTARPTRCTASTASIPGR